MSTSIDFEHWLRFAVPWQLNVSASKQVAMGNKFHHFADHVRRLEKKAPTEIRQFFEALQSKMKEVHKWRAPKGTRVSMIITNGQLETYPNRKPRYHLVEKRKKPRNA